VELPCGSSVLSAVADQDAADLQEGGEAPVWMTDSDLGQYVREGGAHHGLLRDPGECLDRAPVAHGDGGSPPGHDLTVRLQVLRLSDHPREYVVRCMSSVSDRPLDPAAVLDELGDTPDAGAVVLFSGVVRDHDAGRTVNRLEYEGHPTADQVLEEVVREVLSRHPEVRGAAAHHRVGLLAIGDTAMVVVTCAAHRQAAFAATADVVEEVKARLPVWKRQVFTDGTEEWVNSA